MRYIVSSLQCYTQQPDDTREDVMETSLLVSNKSTYYCNKLLLHIVDYLRDICVVGEIILES